ncbi:MAG: FecR domain-containing protein, partial [Proteobacteria bacterium]|nr:FecR domain-containing protein [Pseudomonadota bacterium]
MAFGLISCVRFVGVVAAVLVLILTASATAAAPKPPLHVGRTTSVVEDVRGRLTGNPERRLVNADRVFFNENIVTAKRSVVVVQFRDGSTLELGPNGALVIDELVFNPFERTSRKVVSLLQGSFRYVSAYVAQNSDVTIHTPTGTIGIRGSAVSGFYYPNVPLFVHVSAGTSTFTNDAGSATIQAGQSMASPDRTTPPMPPDRMPPAVAAQALGHIQFTLSASTATGTQVLGAAERAADAAANVVSAAAQVQAGAQTTATIPIIPAVTPDMSLLTGAASLGLLSADAPSTPTPQQQTFLNQAAAAIPDARTLVSAVTVAEKQQNETNTLIGTSEVVTGVAENAKSADQISTLIQATIAANPEMAALAAKSAVAGATTNISISAATSAEAALRGVITGAVEIGADANAAASAATLGVLTGAVEAGIDLATITSAATHGAVAAAADIGIDVGAIAKATTEGALIGAAAAGLDVVSVARAATQGAVAAAREAGLDVNAIIAATTEGAAEAAAEVG